MSFPFFSSMASANSSFFIRMQNISVIPPTKFTERKLLFKHVSQIASSQNKEEDQLVQRRTANYKPNIWKYDQLQSLSSEYADAKYQSKAKLLKQDLSYLFTEIKDQTEKLQLIDSISKLGLANYFEMEIKETLDSIVSSSGKDCCSVNREGLYATALCFRLLRQHGYYASQDMFLEFFDSGKLISTVTKANTEELLELFEASHLATDGENILAEARFLCIQCLKSFAANSDHTISTRVSQALSLPLHWRVGWYNVKRHINEHEMEKKALNFKLIELAKVNFNILQSRQQQDLNDVIRWWLNLGIMENMSFCRDRIVESFMYAVGVGFEHQHSSLRRWLTKVVKLILVIDDVYDVYGSLEELECFTNAVIRWNPVPEDVKDLPENLNMGFWAMYNTTNEIAMETENEKCWTSVKVLPYLQQTWTDFCKAMLVESKWYNNGYTPSLREYLNNGWISSSGPLLSVHIIFFVANPSIIKNVPEFLKESQDIIYHLSLIIRLCNDLGTSSAELERGDAPSSILCYMRECNVTEEAAREHIRSIIIQSWRKINNSCKEAAAAGSTESAYLNKYIINGARMAHLIYQHGDGFGIQGNEATTEVLSTIIEPFPI